MAWRVLCRESLIPSHHNVELVDAEAVEPFVDLPEAAAGVRFGTSGVYLATAADVAVRVVVGVGKPPRRPPALVEGTVQFGSAGIALGAAPLGGEIILPWPAGRTRITVYADADDPFQRRRVDLALEPLDARLSAQQSDVAADIERSIQRLANPFSREAAIRQLVKIGHPAVPRLLETLDNTVSPSEARYGAACALGKIGGEAVTPALLRAIDSPDARVRRGAVTGLYELVYRGSLRSDARVMDALLASLTDHEERISSFAANTLGLLGERRALPQLLDLATGPYVDVLDAVLVAIGQIGDPQVLPLLQRISSGDDERDFGLLEPNIRGAANHAIALITQRHPDHPR